MSYIPLPCLSDRVALNSLIDFFLLDHNKKSFDENINYLKKVTRVCSNTIDSIVNKKNYNNIDPNSENNKSSTKYNQQKDCLSITSELSEALLNDDKLNDGLKILANNTNSTIDQIVLNQITHISQWEIFPEFCNYRIINIIAKNNVGVDFILILKITYLSKATSRIDRTPVENTHILFVNKKSDSEYKICKIIKNDNNPFQWQQEIIDNGNSNNSRWLLNALDPNYERLEIVKLQYMLLNIDGTNFTHTQHISNDFIPITTYELYTDLISTYTSDTLEGEEDNYNEQISKILERINVSFILKINIRLRGVNSQDKHGGTYPKNIYTNLYFKATDKREYFYIIDIEKIQGDYRLSRYHRHKYNNNNLLENLLEIIKTKYSYNISDITRISYKIITIDEGQGGGKYSVKTQFKEVLGKKMRIYKIANSRKEHVKYKGDIIRLSEYRKLMEKKSNSKKVLKAKKAVVANKK